MTDGAVSGAPGRGGAGSRRAAIVGAGGVGVGVVLYPFTLAPAANVWPWSACGLVCLVVTLVARARPLITVTASVLALAYALGLFVGGVGLDPFAAVFAVAWLLLCELLDTAVSRELEWSSPSVLRRRVAYVGGICLLGCVVALVTEVAESMFAAAGVGVLVVSAVCGVTALAGIASLAIRFLESGRRG